MSGPLPLFHLSSLFRHDYYCSTGFFHPIGPRHVLVPLPFLYFQVQTIYLFNNFLKLFYTSFHLLFNIHNFLFTTLLFLFLQYLGFSTTKYGYKYMSVYFFNMTTLFMFNRIYCIAALCIVLPHERMVDWTAWLWSMPSSSLFSLALPMFPNWFISLAPCMPCTPFGRYPLPSTGSVSHHGLWLYGHAPDCLCWTTAVLPRSQGTLGIMGTLGACGGPFLIRSWLAESFRQSGGGL